MSTVDVLAIILATGFGALALAKLLATAGMPERAAHLGFTTTAYRAIGVLELLAVLGLLAGFALPTLGTAAAVGLLALLGGAVVSHLRRGDGARELVPALVMGATTGAYLLFATAAIQ